jgi:hypothetical protein
VQDCLAALNLNHGTPTRRAFAPRRSTACRWIPLCLAVAAATSLSARAGHLPDLAGRWELDARRSGPTVDVWGQTRPAVITIVQSVTEVEVRTEGGGIPVPPEAQRYLFLDRVVDDDSLGLPYFTRKVRTSARWDGEALVIESETLSESRDQATGTVQRGRGITSIWRFHLEDSGRTLVLERTGRRADPPAILHGRPYNRADDQVYNVDIVRYRRVNP